MGANLANEVAEEKFCETTIGCEDRELGSEYKLLFQTDNFTLIHSAIHAGDVDSSRF